jgi:hypothetical protein
MGTSVRASGAGCPDRRHSWNGVSRCLPVLLVFYLAALPGCAPRVRAGEADVRAEKPGAGPSGKSPGKTPLPTDTLAAYRQALERDDPAAAYRLLSPTAQQHLSFEKWSARWKETPLERAAQHKLLLEGQNLAGSSTSPSTSSSGDQAGGQASSSSKGVIAMQAAIALPQGTELVMAPTPSGTQRVSRFTPSLQRSLHRSTDWQVADPDLAAVHAETPEQVLRLLIEAVEQRNYFALLRLLSTTERKALETELRERIDRLRSSLSRKKSPAVEVRGDRAHYQYDPRFFVDLVRERDGWRVLDLN